MFPVELMSHRYRPSVQFTRGKVEGIPATYKGRGVVSSRFPGRTKFPSHISEKINSFIGKKTLENTKRMAKYVRKNQKKKRVGKLRKRIPRLLQPKYKLVKAKAVNYRTFTNVAGALERQTVSVNDWIDPFGGASTQQPLGVDQWGALYNRAVVVGTKLTVKIHNGTNLGYMAGITLTNEHQGETALTEYEHYMELPRTTSRVLSPDMDHTVQSLSCSVKKLFGIKNVKDEEELQTQIGNSTFTHPTREAYFHVWAQPLDQTTAPSTGSYQVVITAEYIVLLFDPIIPSRSTE